MFTVSELTRIEWSLECKVAELNLVTGTDERLSKIVSEYGVLIKKVRNHMITDKKLEQLTH